MPVNPAPKPATPATKIKINVAVLKRMCAVNQFKIPDGVDIVFFGIRGAVPEVNHYDATFKYTTEANVILSDYNHKNFRCTMGQWLVKEGKIGLFLGSTVPGIGGMEDAMDGSTSVNMLLTGYYTDYIKGFHLSSKPTGHQAFRQNAEHPVRRTKEDLTFETTDPIDFGIQNDNIHAAYTDDMTRPPNASHGCQIILGRPHCSKDPRFPTETAAWKIFRTKAYSYTQEVMPYILLEGKDYLKYGVDLATKTNVRLRFGSSGDTVEAMQKALIEKGAKTLKLTKVLDVATMKALIDLQKKAGSVGPDGVVGLITATQIGITLPQV